MFLRDIDSLRRLPCVTAAVVFHCNRCIAVVDVMSDSILPGKMASLSDDDRACYLVGLDGAVKDRMLLKAGEARR